MPVDVYKGIKAVAALEQRKISGQLRHMFHRYLEMEGIELQHDDDTIESIGVCRWWRHVLRGKRG